MRRGNVGAGLALALLAGMEQPGNTFEITARPKIPDGFDLCERDTVYRPGDTRPGNKPKTRAEKQARKAKKKQARRIRKLKGR